MLVCHCHQVSDRIIRTCIRDGAETVADVGERCGAGTSCGGCRPTVKALISALVVGKELRVFQAYDQARREDDASGPAQLTE